jgi:AcrR family transcriptional regulator
VPRPREGTRARLLDAALDAFARHGFAGASIRAITRAVGVRESAFYAHFASKQAAYEELFAEAGPAVVARLVDEIPADASPGDVLPALAREIIAAWSTPHARAFASVVVREAFGGNTTSRTALLGGIEHALAGLARQFAAWGAAQPETKAYQFVSPIVMARFLFFTVDANEAEMRRGAALVAAHAASFVASLAQLASRG